MADSITEWFHEADYVFAACGCSVVLPILDSPLAMPSGKICPAHRFADLDAGLDAIRAKRDPSRGEPIPEPSDQYIWRLNEARSYDERRLPHDPPE